jgi:hypothetical protein
MKTIRLIIAQLLLILCWALNITLSDGGNQQIDKLIQKLRQFLIELRQLMKELALAGWKQFTFLTIRELRRGFIIVEMSSHAEEKFHSTGDGWTYERTSYYSSEDNPYTLRKMREEMEAFSRQMEQEMNACMQQMQQSMSSTFRF